MIYRRDIVLEGDGVSVVGTFSEPGEAYSAGPAVVLLPSVGGNPGHIELLNSIAHGLGQHGMTAFAVKTEAVSPPRIDKLLAHAEHAVAYLRAQATVDSRQIGVLGVGLGACIAARLLTTDSRLRSAAFVSAIRDVRVLDGKHWFWSWGERGGQRLRMDKDWMSHAASSGFEEAYADVEVPTLLIHGNRDVIVPLQHSQQIRTEREQAGRSVKLVTIDGGDHQFLNENLRQFVTDHVTRWFVQMSQQPQFD